LDFARETIGQIEDQLRHADVDVDAILPHTDEEIGGSVAITQRDPFERHGDLFVLDDLDGGKNAHRFLLRSQMLGFAEPHGESPLRDEDAGDPADATAGAIDGQIAHADLHLAILRADRVQHEAARAERLPNLRDDDAAVGPTDLAPDRRHARRAVPDERAADEAAVEQAAHIAQNRLRQRRERSDVEPREGELGGLGRAGIEARKEAVPEGERARRADVERATAFARWSLLLEPQVGRRSPLHQVRFETRGREIAAERGPSQ
jgi:hypothetical protein